MLYFTARRIDRLRKYKNTHIKSYQFIRMHSCITAMTVTLVYFLFIFYLYTFHRLMLEKTWIYSFLTHIKFIRSIFSLWDGGKSLIIYTREKKTWKIYKKRRNVVEKSRKKSRKKKPSGMVTYTVKCWQRKEKKNDKLQCALWMKTNMTSSSIQLNFTYFQQ